MADNVKVNPDQDKNKRKFEIDSKFDNGPIEERHCTDILCCLVFIAAIVALVVIAITGWKNGQPKKLLALYDASNKSCSLDLPQYPYLYFPIPHPDYLNYTTCVASCPKEAGSASFTTLDCNTINNSLIQTCIHSCTPISFSAPSGTNAYSTSISVNWTSLFCIYKTITLLDRICWPTPEIITTLDGGNGTFSKQLSAAVNTDTLAQWFNDLKEGWKVIAGSVGFAVLIGFFSGLIVWIVIAAYIILMAVLGYIAYLKFKTIEDNQKNTSSSTSENNVGSNTDDNKDTYRITAYVLWGICGLSILGVICYYNKIRLAIAVIKTATLYIIDVPLALLVPPVFSIFVSCWWIFWIIGMIYLYSFGDIQKSAKTPFAAVTHTQEQKGYLWYFLFGGLWVNAFIQATCQFILGSSTCIWYFSQGEGGGVHKPLSRSIYRAFRYHLGSLAFGSFLLAVVQFIRVVLAYIKQQMKQTGADKNKLMKCLIDCLQCYVACFERFIEFLNRNAYIQIAITGNNFCVAAKDAMSIIWNNMGRMALVNGIGGVFIWVGKLFITAATVLICYEILLHAMPYKETVSSPFLPCILILFISYAIAVNFMSVYGMAMDAILMCFLYDEELAKGRGNQKPKHCPDTLVQFFDDIDKK